MSPKRGVFSIAAVLLLCATAGAQRDEYYPGHIVVPVVITAFQGQFLIETDTESVPNAVPLSSPHYGDTSPACFYSVDSGDPNPNCNNPLAVGFDAQSVPLPGSGTAPALIGNLNDSNQGGSQNLLEGTNSVDSNDGGLSNLAASFGCQSNTPGTGGSVRNMVGSTNELIGTITVTMEDASVFTFTIGPGQICDLTSPLTGTFTSSGGASNDDAGTFTLYSYQNSENSGTYTGSFDGSSVPLQQNGEGSTSINLQIASDFTVLATAFLPAGSLGACQVDDATFSTQQAIALGVGVNATVGGYATGGNLLLAMADQVGNVEWVIGSSTDDYGNFLPVGDIFFTAYGPSGECVNIYSWDNIFEKQSRSARKVHPRGVHKPRNLPGAWRRGFVSGGLQFSPQWNSRAVQPAGVKRSPLN